MPGCYELSSTMSNSTVLPLPPMPPSNDDGGGNGSNSLLGCCGWVDRHTYKAFAAYNRTKECYGSYRSTLPCIIEEDPSGSILGYDSNNKRNSMFYNKDDAHHHSPSQQHHCCLLSPITVAEISCRTREWNTYLAHCRSCPQKNNTNC